MIEFPIYIKKIKRFPAGRQPFELLIEPRLIFTNQLINTIRVNMLSSLFCYNEVKVSVELVDTINDFKILLNF